MIWKEAAMANFKARRKRVKPIITLGATVRLCGAVKITGYTTKMYCASCEVRTEFMYVM
jgi:hypothetical protein